MTESDEFTMRRVRYNLGRAEDCLDIATSALSRANEIDPGWAQEFVSDVDLLRSKLTVLRDLLNGPRPEQVTRGEG